MRKHLNIDWLINRFESGEPLKFLYFWGHTNKYNENVGKFCFSQWYESPFTVDDIEYKTAEHWMMAQKALLFEDHASFRKIVDCIKPGEAKELGRSVLGYDDQTWKENRFEIVRLGNIHKFNQNPALAEYLLNTENRILVEASPVDVIWGIGLAADHRDADNIYAWRGENLLGFALMEVRQFLREFGLFKPLDISILPPWKAFPGVESIGMFWNMGKGEEYISNFGEQYRLLSDRQKKILALTYPEPNDWKGYWQ